MFKTTAIAVATLATSMVGFAAVPAMAQSSTISLCQPSNFEVSDRETLIKMQLKRKGVNATSVYDWNGCVQAIVRNGDGTSSIQYFHPRTLEPVHDLVNL